LDARAVAQRAAEFENVRIRHTAMNECLRELEELHASGPYLCGRASGLLFYGLSGSGKSTMVREYAERYPRAEETDRTVLPVLLVVLPSKPTAKAIAEHILVTMGDPAAGVGTAELKIARVMKLFRECRVELVIFDEMQHLLGLDARARDTAADMLKNLMNTTNVPYAFVGTHEVLRYFVAHRQLGRRCSPKFCMEPYGFRSVPDRREFLRLLLSVHESLPASGASPLIEPSLAGAFHFATFGLIGILTALVARALKITLRTTGGAVLTREALHRAFVELFYEKRQCPRRRNPFDPTFDGLPLTGVGEPFHGYES
jgi:hypothetical protein